MKYKARITAAIVIGATLIFGAVTVRAGSFTFLGSLVTVNNTTSNSAPLAIMTVPVSLGTFNIQNAGLSATNTLSVNMQLSMDGTNFQTVATYWPSTTNATTEAYRPTATNVTVYLRAQAVTTTAVQVGGTYQY